MATWIDDAEKRQKDKELRQMNVSLHDDEIVQVNMNNLLPFIERFKFLTDRVAKLDPEHRKPSMEIGYTHLDGDPKYEFYGSAYIIRAKRFLFFSKKDHYYFFWRRCFLLATDTPGLLKITLYEKGSAERGHDIVKKKVKFVAEINSLEEGHAYKIIDWMVFKTGTINLKNQLPHKHFEK